jgi:predicted nucleic acid-binding protein
MFMAHHLPEIVQVGDMAAHHPPRGVRPLLDDPPRAARRSGRRAPQLADDRRTLAQRATMKAVRWATQRRADYRDDHPQTPLMADFYFDSSALAKRYVSEPGSTWARRITARHAGNSSYVVRITGAERVASLALRARVGTLSSVQTAAAIARFKAGFRRGYAMIEVSASIVSAAMDLAERHGPRGYDSVQLASAMELRSTLLPGEPPHSAVLRSSLPPMVPAVCSEEEIDRMHVPAWTYERNGTRSDPINIVFEGSPVDPIRLAEVVDHLDNMGWLAPGKAFGKSEGDDQRLDSPSVPLQDAQRLFAALPASVLTSLLVRHHIRLWETKETSGHDVIVAGAHYERVRFVPPKHEVISFERAEQFVASDFGWPTGLWTVQPSSHPLGNPVSRAQKAWNDGNATIIRK